jgi:hypothetical protein
MSQKAAVIATIVGLVTGVGIQLFVAHMDHAVQQQCMKHEWPQHQDEAHKDWCTDNGYSI